MARHVEISLNALIDRAQLQYAEYDSRRLEGKTVQGLEGLISQAEQHLDELNNRLDARRRELDQERHCTIGDILHIGRAMVLPHPERQTPQIAPMVRDDEVEKLAVKVATEHEQARGFVVESVESEDRGFDLISRRPHPEDPKTFTEVRFIEVKGRAGVGEIFLSANEYKAAERLKGDYWLYAVYNCGSTARSAHRPGPGPARLAAGDEGRALQGQAERRAWRLSGCLTIRATTKCASCLGRTHGGT